MSQRTPRKRAPKRAPKKAPKRAKGAKATAAKRAPKRAAPKRPPPPNLARHYRRPDPALPALAGVDFALPALCGELRGKRYRPSDAAKALATGLMFPASGVCMDAQGEVTDARHGLGIRDGDPDALARPDPSTWLLQPWSDPLLALVLCDLLEPGTDSLHWLAPRTVLHHSAQAFARETGLTVRAAFELEFFLLAPRAHEGGAPRLHAAERPGAETYALAPLAAPGHPAAEISRLLQATGLPVGALTHEAAPGQYEINLRPADSPLRAADEAVLLRHGIAASAASLDARATFCPKPFARAAGSALQVNLSLLDKEGRNILNPETSSPHPLARLAPPRTSQRGGAGKPPRAPQMTRAMGAALSGLLRHAPEAMLLFSPHLNAYRRFEPGQFAPTSLFWARDDRNAALRLPIALKGEETRIEHRIAASDANPYLVLAALLASIALSLESDTPAPREGKSLGELPSTFLAAHARAAKGGPLKRRLDAWTKSDYFALYTETKAIEFHRLLSVPSSAEWAWYL